MSDWLARLAPGPLPVFAHTKQILLEQLRRSEEITAREVAQTILSDPLASLALIHAANQRGGHLGGEAVTVENALMMLGIGRYLEQACNLSVLEDTPIGRDAKLMAAMLTLLRRSYHAAWQARDFAVLHSDVRAEEVQIAALFHAAPEFLLLLRAPAEARQLNRLKRRMAEEEAQRQVLDGNTLEQLRLPLLANWKVAQLIRDLLDPVQAGKTRQVILSACTKLAQRSQFGWWDEALLDDYLALSSIDQLTLEMVVATAHANAMHAERAGGWIAAPGAGVWMPMLPGPWPAEEDEEEATPATTVAAAKAVEHTICPMPDKKVLREALQGIESHMDGTLNLTQMSAIILKGLHTGLGLSRILFAMLTPDGKNIKSRFTLGIPAGEPLRHFAFSLESRDLFGQLMGKMQGMWMNEGNRAKLWPLVHPDLQKMIGCGDFYAMSLYANGKAIGLIYADRGHGECGLDPLTYTDFKMLCLQAARGLGKVK